MVQEMLETAKKDKDLESIVKTLAELSDQDFSYEDFLMSLEDMETELSEDYDLETDTEEPEEEMINPVETESMPDETIHGLSERLEQMTGQYQEPEMYPDAYAENGSEPSAYEAYEQALPEETVEQGN